MFRVRKKIARGRLAINHLVMNVASTLKVMRTWEEMDCGIHTFRQMHFEIFIIIVIARVLSRALRCWRWKEWKLSEIFAAKMKTNLCQVVYDLNCILFMRFFCVFPWRDSSWEIICHLINSNLCVANFFRHTLSKFLQNISTPCNYFWPSSSIKSAFTIEIN